MTYTITLEPVGVQMEVEEGETILNAAFRQGIALMHGCKEGQCSTCKSVLVDGDVDMERYSTFALPDYEKENGYILLCKAIPYSDSTVQLLQYDEEALKVSVPIKNFRANVSEIESLTHDIRRLVLKLNEPAEINFHAGQFVDIYLPGTTNVYRSYSMANTPNQSNLLEFMIKVFKGGKFSTLLDEQLSIGQELEVRGPFGNCICREGTSEVFLIGGGSGMAPLWSILGDIVEKGSQRKVTLFYGARTKRDLFYMDKFAAIAERYPGFRFIPALSEPDPKDGEWDGETGFITKVVEDHLDSPFAGKDLEVFLCGPAPMIDATIPVLKEKGVTVDRIFFDKFVPASN